MQKQANFKTQVYLGSSQVIGCFAKKKAPSWMLHLTLNTSLKKDTYSFLSCDYVSDLLLEESNVQPVSTPVTVCGDIHGQVTPGIYWNI